MTGAVRAMMVMVVLGAVPPATYCSPPSVEAAVDAAWAEVDAAWNARDAARFSAVYTEDSSFEFVDRRHALDGRAAIRQHFEGQFPRTAAEYSHHTRIETVRAVADGAVTVDGVVEIRSAPAEAGQESSLFRTFAIFAVMVPAADAWQIDALRVYQLPVDGS